MSDNRRELFNRIKKRSLANSKAMAAREEMAKLENQHQEKSGSLDFPDEAARRQYLLLAEKQRQAVEQLEENQLHLQQLVTGGTEEEQ